MEEEITLSTLNTLKKSFETGETLQAGELNAIINSVNGVIQEVNNRKGPIEKVIKSLNSAVERIDDIEESLNNQEESSEVLKENKNLFTGVLTGTGWKVAEEIGEITGNVVMSNNIIGRSSSVNYIVSPQVPITAGSTYTLSFKSPNLFSGNYNIYLVKDNNTIQTILGNGSWISSFSCNFNAPVSENIRIYISSIDNIYYPQLEEGRTATEFSTSTFEVSEYIGKVKEGLISSYPTNENKNMFTGVLTGTGWDIAFNINEISANEGVTMKDYKMYRISSFSGIKYIVSPPTAVTAGSTYTLSFKSSPFSGNYNINVVGENGNIIKGTADNVSNKSNFSLRFTAPLSENIRIYIGIDGIYYPLLEEGEIVSEFNTSSSEISEYIRKVNSKVNILKEDKNLISLGALTGNGWTDGNNSSLLADSYGGLWSDSSEYYYSPYITTLEDTIFSFYYESALAPQVQIIIDSIININPNSFTPSLSVSSVGESLFINGSNIPRWKATIPASTESFRIRIVDNRNGVSIYHPQLEKIEDNTEPTAFEVNPTEITSLVRQSSNNLTENLGLTGIDITNKLVNLKANKTLFSTNSGTPMIALQMCDALGNIWDEDPATASNYPIPSIVFYDGEIGESGTAPLYILNYLGLTPVSSVLL